MNDLEYIDHGMFTSFLPASKAGEVAFNQMAEYTDGTGKVLRSLKGLTVYGSVVSTPGMVMAWGGANGKNLKRYQGSALMG